MDAVGTVIREVALSEHHCGGGNHAGIRINQYAIVAGIRHEQVPVPRINGGFDEVAALLISAEWSSNVIVPIGKPTVIFSSDDVTTKGQMQLELSSSPPTGYWGGLTTMVVAQLTGGDPHAVRLWACVLFVTPL